MSHRLALLRSIFLETTKLNRPVPSSSAPSRLIGEAAIEFVILFPGMPPKLPALAPQSGRKFQTRFVLPTSPRISA